MAPRRVRETELRLHRIEQRLRDTEQRLRETEEQLRDANKVAALGRVASGVAHDFSNILSVILASTSFLCEDIAPGDPLREDVDEIRSAAERGSRLTRQLLAFSRRQVHDPRVVDLDALLAGMERLLRRMVGDAIAVEVVPSPERAHVIVDPTQLEQVVLNLAVNARDAMPAGGTLRLECTADGTTVALAVSDTGCGMDAETCARMFEPFFTTKDHGTGLGLATVFAIVEQTGGDIRVDSELERGTTIAIRWPRTALEVLATAPAPVGPLARARGETVLVVEDDDAVRRAIAGQLVRLGYRTLVAANAGEALLVCERHAGQIDLLLADVGLPIVDGRELAGRLARLRAGMRVVFMSGDTGDADALCKPIRPDQLARRLRVELD